MLEFDLNLYVVICLHFIYLYVIAIHYTSNYNILVCNVSRCDCILQDKEVINLLSMLDGYVRLGERSKDAWPATDGATG